jgi:hypothetical protein
MYIIRSGDGYIEAREPITTVSDRAMALEMSFEDACACADQMEGMNLCAEIIRLRRCGQLDEDARRAITRRPDEHLFRVKVDVEDLALITRVLCHATDCANHAEDRFACGLKDLVIRREGTCGCYKSNNGSSGGPPYAGSTGCAHRPSLNASDLKGE